MTPRDADRLVSHGKAELADELALAIELLRPYLHPHTSDEEPGEAEAYDKAMEILGRYKVVAAQTSSATS